MSRDERKPLVRKSPLRRSSGIPRGKRIAAARIKRRKRKPQEAERIYGPPEFRDWLHQQPCCVTGWTGYIEQAHVRNGGTGRKADWQWTIPLDRILHHELHQHGQRTFEEKYEVKLIALAEETQHRWQAYTNRSKAA